MAAPGRWTWAKGTLPVSSLSAAQQALVLAAMESWVRDADDATAAALLAHYQSQLPTTYLAYSGDPTLTTASDYARLDGPDVWIEFVCQTGMKYPSRSHYHTIWCDHARDYGGDYYTAVTRTQLAQRP